MSKPTPCVCPAPNPECRRSGFPGVGRLYEICSGNCPAERPCPPGMSEQYRTAWDAKFRPKPAGPTRRQRLRSFALALWRHARDWFRRVGEAEYYRRLATCRSNACGRYQKGDRCGVCGCGLSGAILAKARMKSEKCPKGMW